MDIHEDIEVKLKTLEGHLINLVQLGRMNIEAKPQFYMFDVFITGLLNRSVNIIKGFLVLFKDNNFIAAAPLVRIHLDSLLRLYAPQLIDCNVDLFARDVFNGKPVRNFVGKENKKLTDSYLVEKISQEKVFEWVKKVYDTGNSFVHFSDQTIFASLRAQGEERKVDFTIGQHDVFIPIEEKHGSVHWMNEITEGIIYLVYCWIEQKKSYTTNDG